MKPLGEWDEFYLGLATVIAENSYAPTKVGCLIVKDGNIISFSYNGTPAGWSNQTKKDGHTMPHVLHAEAQAIVKVARSTMSTEDATMYCTLSPCMECAKLIGEAGIQRLVYNSRYKDTTGTDHLLQKGVTISEY